MTDERQEKGVILQKLAYSDADEIITVLFEKSGVKRLFVRGSRKSKKRFGGRIDHFEELSFQYTSKDQGLGMLRAIDNLPGSIRSKALNNIFSFAFLNYISEIIREFFWEEARADEVYELWQDLAAEIKDDPLSLERAIFYHLRILSLAGYDLSTEATFQTLLHDLKSGVAIPKQKWIVLFRYPEQVLERHLKTLEFLLSVLP